MKNNILKQLAQYIPFSEEENKAVSKRAVDWHLDHTIKIINLICKALMESNPEKYRSRFNAVKSFILLTGYIPRGMGKAPQAFNNQENTSVEKLIEMLAEAEKNFKAIESLPPNSYFRHPLFGDMNLRQAKKFILIHSQHHLKIIRDILKD